VSEAYYFRTQKSSQARLPIDLVIELRGRQRT
jgi:hypothetical protein